MKIVCLVAAMVMMVVVAGCESAPVAAPGSATAAVNNAGAARGNDLGIQASGLVQVGGSVR